MPGEFVARQGLISRGNVVVTGSLTTSGSLTATGTITATTLVVQTVTSSISSITGSTNFGSLSSNTHTFTGSINASGSATFSSSIDGTIINSTSNAFRLNGNNALNLVTLNAQSVVKINAAGFWGVQLVGANDQGLLINNTGAATFSNRVTANDYIFTGTGAIFQGTPSAGTSAQYGYFQNTGGVFYFGRDNSTASEFGVGAYSTVLWNSGNNSIVFATNNQAKFRLFGNGRASFNNQTDRGYQLMVSGDASSYAVELRQSNNDANYDLLTLTHEATSGNRRMVIFNTGGIGTVGTIISTNSSTTYNTNSDYRLKQDLKDYNGLNIVDSIKTYDFEWKVDNTRSYGVLAHELQEVLPYAVYGEKDDEQMQGVDYSKIVPVLVKAIQELEARVKELENK